MRPRRPKPLRVMVPPRIATEANGVPMTPAAPTPLPPTGPAGGEGTGGAHPGEVPPGEATAEELPATPAPTPAPAPAPTVFKLFFKTLTGATLLVVVPVEATFGDVKVLLEVGAWEECLKASLLHSLGDGVGKAQW